MMRKPEQGLVHRYMRGVRFDGPWEYRVVSPSGRKRWSCMFPDSARYVATDQEGLGWCLRRCAAVMTQRPLHAIPASQLLTAASDDPIDWRELFEGLKVQSFNTNMRASMNSLATVVERGGCALLKLVLHCRQLGSEEYATCWVWVIGVEMTPSGAAGGNSPLEHHTVKAALVVNQTWGVPWGSGFGARVSWDALGQCVLCSVDGQRLKGSCVQCVVIEPNESCKVA